MIDPIRVLICDDQVSFRNGLQSMLTTEVGIVVCGEAEDGVAAVQAAETYQPDVVLMDLRMPKLDGLEATRRIIASSPHIRILVLTMSDNPTTVFGALQAGERGYIVKGARKAEIMRAIESVHSGEAVFGTAIATQMLTYFSQAHAQPVFPELSQREQEILNLMANNLSNAAIAERLGIRAKTVSNHVSNICTKLQVADRTKAILRVLKR
ncbi:MAG: response regulator transcription factor [Chloroflexi bacterium]|nr:response regulator transcription factor [Chloroflexota bacterium]